MVDQGQHGRILRAHAIERPRAKVREGSADLDLHDCVGEVAEPHPAVLDRDEGTPQTGGAGFGLQLLDDVEERPGSDLGLNRLDHVVDERCDAGADFADIVGNIEIDHGGRHCHC